MPSSKTLKPHKPPSPRPPRPSLPTPKRTEMPETPISPKTSDLAASLGIDEVLRALGLEHAASLLDSVLQKAIARNDSPSSVLDYLMRDQLRYTSNSVPAPPSNVLGYFPLPASTSTTSRAPNPSTARSLNALPPSTSFVSAPTLFLSARAASGKLTSPMPSGTLRVSKVIVSDLRLPLTWSTTSLRPRLVTH